MKKLILALFGTLALFNCGVAHADVVDVTFTGDDNVSLLEWLQPGLPHPPTGRLQAR